MESNQNQCRMQPSVWFLMGTLLFTSVATAMLCGAIMTDHWEHVTWDRSKLQEVANRHKNTTHVKQRYNSYNQWVLEWLLDGEVGRIVYTNDQGLRKIPAWMKPIKTGYKNMDRSTNGVTARNEEQHDEVSVFLIPMHGGIWTLCVSLPDDQRQLLLRVGFTQNQCINYLDPDMTKGEEGRADWQHRMQNLSISCALVCLIILGSSALVGAFGVLKHQISAVLVTGVMYLLAATFAMFTLTIIHFKRQQIKQKPEKTVADCLINGGFMDSGGMSMLFDGVSPSKAAVLAQVQVDPEIFTARMFTTSWSLDLGWGGVTLCVLTSILWILLSKIMRYNPLSTMLT